MSTSPDQSRSASTLNPSWHVIPARKFVTVEHPGYVQNVDYAIESLGGPIRFGKVLNSHAQTKYIKLYLRPEDAFRKPISSTQTETQNIVLKITVPKRTGRKRKRGSSDPFTLSNSDSAVEQQQPAKLFRSLLDNPYRYHVEAIGSANETHRFRTLPDFQFALTNSPLVKSFRESILPFKYAKIENFQFDTTTKGPQPHMEMIPPPSFTQLDLPFNYQYHQNPAVKLTFDADGRPTSINTSIPRRTIISLVDYDVEDVPKAPSPDLLPEDSLPPKVLAALTQIRKLIETRPIITRRVARSLIPDAHERDIQTAFQYIGFTFRSGPWRDAVVKFGLDPRTDPTYRIYQTRTFQIRPATPNTAAAAGSAPQTPAAPPSSLAAAVYQRPLRPAADPTHPSSHLFTGTRLATDSKIWQACDVVDPQLAALLARSTPRAVCDTRCDGWYPNGTWATLHVVMRDKMAVLAAGGVPEDAWYARLLATIPQDITAATVARTVFSARADASLREVTLASEIRALVYQNRNMGGGTRGGWLEGEAGAGSTGAPELQDDVMGEDG